MCMSKEACVFLELKLNSSDHHWLCFGGVSERPKEHAWKACKRDKRFVGSNPTSSANSQPFFLSAIFFATFFFNLLYTLAPVSFEY